MYRTPTLSASLSVKLKKIKEKYIKYIIYVFVPPIHKTVALFSLFCTSKKVGIYSSLKKKNLKKET